MATPSNCGDTLTKALTTKSDGKPSDGQANALGYGKNVKDWVIRSQVLKVNKPMDAVHRLKVGGVLLKNKES
jgi:hypothetical protein